jgi:hypothetical protein
MNSAMLGMMTEIEAGLLPGYGSLTDGGASCKACYD